ncbi:IclR family transcriptional regulator [uncultured Lentibacter sp.]|uniref:IclR family transcriptional regulator n=1 Tax=uncultured Lentibacter sp. TaxID=1659309 RepID=UPI00262B272D|nr:IclR family transcriptional regulator [uncultured Lentibacter sp.]MCW1954782.1 IclR family transcriptional regulator [Roseobacter sp.]
MGTVSKALSLLSFFSRSQSLIGLSEMSRLTGMNKTTVHRMLSELQSEGFVEQAGVGREYRLGPAFLRLAALREATVPMRDLAQNLADDLAQKTGETAHVSLLHGDVLSTIAYAYAHQHGLQVTMDDAEILPLHATSSGHVVLAYSDARFTKAALAGPLKAFSTGTITDRKRLTQLFAEIRTQGYAEAVSAFETDVHSHAAPLFDAQKNCIGAMAVAAPTARMTPEGRASIRAALLEAAPRLTRLMGGFLPDTYVQKAPPA